MKNKMDLQIEIKDLCRQKQRLFGSGGNSPVPDLESKLDFFNREIRKAEKALAQLEAQA